MPPFLEYLYKHKIEHLQEIFKLARPVNDSEFFKFEIELVGDSIVYYATILNRKMVLSIDKDLNINRHNSIPNVRNQFRVLTILQAILRQYNDLQVSSGYANGDNIPN